MGTAVTLNAVAYTIPAVGESNWGQEVTNYLVALGAGVLQKAGGSFTLTAEADFGATYGLKAAYFKSRGTVSSTGIFRLANTELVAWRNAANSADLGVRLSASDWLQFNGVNVADISTAQTLTNKTIDADSNTISNIADDEIKTGAAIAWSKISKSGSNITDIATRSHTSLTDIGTTSHADIDTHIGASAAHGVSGNVVGTTDTQTLSNKTLTSPVINTPTGIVKGDVGLGNVDNTSDATKDAAATTLTNKTLTSPVLNTGVSGTAVKDEDDMVSNSATHLATQQSIKAYVDTQIGTVTTSGAETSAKSADYTITDVDNVRTVLMTTSGTDRTVTLPTAADNDFRIITVKKVDTGTGVCIVDGESTETIDGALSITLGNADEAVTVQSDGTGWHVLDSYRNGQSILAVSANYTVTDIDGYSTINVTVGGADRTITLPSAAAANKGRRITIRRVDAPGFVNTSTFSLLIAGTINGESSTTFNRIKAQYGTCTVESNGSEWIYVQPITESGAWESAYSCSGTSITMNNVETATFQRTHDIVHVRCYMRTSAASSLNGNELVVGGLPYTASVSGSGSCAVTGASAWGGDVPCAARLNGGAASMSLYYRTSVNGADTFSNGNDLATGANSNVAVISGTYRITT